MVRTKLQIIFLVFALSLFFIPQISFALNLLPTQSGFGGSCSVDNDCAIPMVCKSNVCIECQSDANCATGRTCISNVCVTSGGNVIGKNCADNTQCASGNCGANKVCITAATSVAPSVPPPSASGTGLPGENLSIQDVFNIINGLACWLLRVVGGVMVIFLVWAGLRFMAAQSNPASLITAKKNLNYALIGILVIIGVYVIIATVANAVGASFSFIPLVC